VTLQPAQFNAFLTLSEGQQVPLTRGVVDDNARRCFTSGHCNSLSAAIAGATGWEEEHASGAEGNYYDHSYVKTPWGTALDIDGESSLKEMRTAGGPGTYYGSEMAWDIELPGLEEAVDFVKPVLESAGLSHVPVDLDAARERVRRTREAVPHSDPKAWQKKADEFREYYR
jgi:hypothetical protein